MKIRNIRTRTRNTRAVLYGCSYGIANAVATCNSRGGTKNFNEQKLPGRQTTDAKRDYIKIQPSWNCNQLEVVYFYTIKRNEHYQPTQNCLPNKIIIIARPLARGIIRNSAVNCVCNLKVQWDNYVGSGNGENNNRKTTFNFFQIAGLDWFTRCTISRKENAKFWEKNF